MRFWKHLPDIKKSDFGQIRFFTGVFPAEYGNSLAGVFDIKLRSGNPHKREFVFRAIIL
ncbi:MAG: hypothetical protein ACOCYO_07005 [Bacteroidota bacterium]